MCHILELDRFKRIAFKVQQEFTVSIYQFKVPVQRQNISEGRLRLDQIRITGPSVFGV